MNKKPIIIYYQADCAFCNLCKSFIEKRSKPNSFIFKDIYQISQEIAHKEKNAESIQALDQGKHYLKFAACLKISSRMDRPWPLLGKALGIFPHFLGDYVYDLVSHHRNLIMSWLKYLRFKVTDV